MQHTGVIALRLLVIMFEKMKAIAAVCAMMMSISRDDVDQLGISKVWFCLADWTEPRVGGSPSSWSLFLRHFVSLFTRHFVFVIVTDCVGQAVLFLRWKHRISSLQADLFTISNHSRWRKLVWLPFGRVGLDFQAQWQRRCNFILVASTKSIGR